MEVFKSIRLLTTAALVSLTLSACNSVVFPEIDENEEDVALSDGGRVAEKEIKEGASLKADRKNVAYEGGEEVKEPEEPQLPKEAVIPEEDKVVPAKTKPVVVADRNNMEEETVAEETPEEKAEAMIDDMLGTADEPSVNYRAETILFANGSAVVDRQYNQSLRNLVKTAKAHDATLKVYGYASSRTRNTDIASHKLANFEVSLKRAENVASLLRKFGMPKDKIVVEALSDSVPMYQEVMPEGERLNRRAEVYIVY